MTLNTINCDSGDSGQDTAGTGAILLHAFVSRAAVLNGNPCHVHRVGSHHRAHNLRRYMRSAVFSIPEYDATSTDGGDGIGLNVGTVNATDADGDTLYFLLDGVGSSQFSISSTDDNVRSPATLLCSPSCLCARDPGQHPRTVHLCAHYLSSCRRTLRWSRWLVTMLHIPLSGKRTNTQVPLFAPQGAPARAVSSKAHHRHTVTHWLVRLRLHSLPSQGVLHNGVGFIRNAVQFDFERISTNPNFFFGVIVTDRDPEVDPEERLQAVQQIIVRITDINEHAPEFPARIVNAGGYTPAALDEDIREDTEVERTTAYDQDSGRNGQVVYSIVSGNGDGAFRIGRSNAVISVNATLNYELSQGGKHNYTLGIRATDRGSPSRSSDISVFIEIHDRNDNAPVFAETEYTATVSEAAVNGTIIVDVLATDVDSAANGNGVVVYDVLNSDRRSSNLFRALENGTIVLVGELNFESATEHRLYVAALDSPSESRDPQQRTLVSLVVTVVDANDNIPVWTNNNYDTTIQDGASEGDLVLEIHATDADESGSDNAAVRYGLQDANGGDITAFRVDAATGRVYVNIETIDYDLAERSYTIFATATDLGTPALAADPLRVTITVVDVNGQLRRVCVCGCVWGGGAGCAFIPIRRCRWYRRVPAHTSPFLSSFGFFSFAHSKDNPPIFSAATLSINPVSIPEDYGQGRQVATVQASDIDSGVNGQVSYRISAQDTTAPFSLVASGSGAVVQLARDGILDFESRVNWEVEIEAYDGGQPTPRTATFTIEIQVTDVNEFAPQFEQTPYSCTVDENADVRQLRHHLWAIFTWISVPPNTVVRHALPSAQACWVLIGACDMMF